MNVTVYNQSGKDAGTMELPDGVFGLKWNADLVHQVVTSQTANKRIRVAHAKDRSEVRGGGKKPWKQKGTGRARHGSIRSPIWKGGGVTHGPRNLKNYKKKINKKMAKKALWMVLSAKARDNEIVVMDSLKFSDMKTKSAARTISSFSSHASFAKMRNKNGVLVVLPKHEMGIARIFKNLSYAETKEVRNLNAAEVLQYRYLLIPQESVSLIK